MRNIRTKRVRTEAVNPYSQPFQESVLEIELEKHHRCLLQIQKNHFDNAAQLLSAVAHDRASLALPQRDRSMIHSLTLTIRSYLLHRQRNHDQALRCLQEAQQDHPRYENLLSMKNALCQLVTSVILCQQGKIEESKQAAQQAFATIKREREAEPQPQPQHKNIQRYSQIFIIFFDMIAIDLSKLLKFQDILSLYREGHHLSEQILGKTHKLTLLMRRILLDHSKDRSKEASRDKTISIKLLHSKRRLKINEQKILTLSTKQREMKRIYNDNDETLLSNLNNSKKLTKRDENYFLRSLEKVKSIYPSRSKNRNNLRTDCSAEEKSGDSLFFNRLAAETTNQGSRRRIKDIILQGRRLNRNMIYISESEYARTEEAHFEMASEVPNETIASLVEELPRSVEKVEKREEAAKGNELTFTSIAHKLEQAREEKQEGCQLI